MAHPAAQIDELIETAQRLRPECRPGERMVAGKPYVYDAELLLSFIARETVRSAGPDLSDLTLDQLDFLRADCMRRQFDTRYTDEQAADLWRRAFEEISLRTDGVLVRREAPLEPIPVLEPIRVTVRALDPAAWGVSHTQAAEQAA